MKCYLFFILQCVLCLPLIGKTIVVAGENYLLFDPGDSNPKIVKDLESKSWALDPNGCRLWVTTKSQEPFIQLYQQGQLVKQMKFLGTIVSDFQTGRFFTRPDQGALQQRDSDGEIISELKMIDSSFVKSVIAGSDGDLWTLNQGTQSVRRESLWVSRTKGTGKTTPPILIESDTDLWGGLKLVFDPKERELWVGYSSSSPQHTYTPRVKLFSEDGKLKRSFYWQERGVFFDGCLEKRGSFLMARDIPTMPFTVPVYSFIERLEKEGNANPVIDLDLNLLVDSMACESNNLYAAVHSILGGEARQVIQWDKKDLKSSEIVLNLPGRANKIWVCENPSS